MIKFKITKIDIRDLSRSDRYDKGRTTSKVSIFETNNPAAKPVVELFNGYRHNRPYVDYREQVMPAVIKAMGLPTDTKIRWSQKAGCSCGCSPGFIVAGGIPKNVFVNVEVFASQPELIEA